MNNTQLVQDVIDGNESALLALALLKEQKKELDVFIDAIADEVEDEAVKYSEKTFELKGFKFEKRAGGRYYDYSHIKIWAEANNIKKEIETRAKAAASSQKIGMQVADDDGCEIELPMVKYKKDSIIIKKIN